MNTSTPHRAPAAITRAVLAAACGLGSLPALAQGVTLAGIADAAARQVSNTGSGSVRSLISGGNSTSRLVIRGTEDLGDGLSAGFWLEHGIALDTGAQASATNWWDRRSTVSLSGKVWGEVRAGRDFVPSYMNWSRYDPFSYVGVAGSNNLVSATPTGPVRSAFGTSPNTTVRSSNSVQWLLPSGWAGLEGGVMVAAQENGTAANGQHKLVGARLGWQSKDFGVSAAHTVSENNLTTTGKFKDSAVGGNGQFAGVRFSAAYRVFEQASAKQKNLLLGVWVPVGSGEIKASWTRVDLGGRVGNTVIDANDAQQLGIGYVHPLSRRSVLYGTLARIENKGTASFVIPGGGAIAAGGSSKGLEFGVRHSF